MVATIIRRSAKAALSRTAPTRGDDLLALSAVVCLFAYRDIAAAAVIKGITVGAVMMIDRPLLCMLAWGRERGGVFGMAAARGSVLCQRRRRCTPILAKGQPSALQLPGDAG